MKIFERLFKKNIDNKGVTLVELICAVAILSMVGAVIVGLVLATTNSYQRSVQEIEVQQEAQFAANLIGDLVKDATRVSGDANKIEIEKGGVLYTITYDAERKRVEINDGSGSQLMAEHMDGLPFVPDASGSVHEVSMSVSRDDNSNALNLINSNNSRNEDVSGNFSAGEIFANIISPSEMVLEPNVQQEIIYTVTGTPDKRVRWTLTGNNDPNTKMDGNTIKIGTSETANTLYVNGETLARKSDGITPAANTSIIVYIRRVTGVTLKVKLMSGADGELGAHYRFTANVSGVNLERKPSMETDYITPYAIDWTCDYRVNGVTVDNFDDYFNVTVKHEGNGVDENYADIYINRKIEPGSYFIIQANSAHANGIRQSGRKGNKSGIPYGAIYENHLIEGHIYTLYPGNFYRGSDVRQGELNEWAVISIISGQNGIPTYYISSVFKEFRFKVTGTNNWTPWITLNEGGNAIRIHEDSWMFACDKDYDIEIRFGCMTIWGVKLYPTALGENAYTIKTTLEHSKIRFDVSTDKFSQNDIYGVGPVSNPIRMSVNSILNFNVNRAEAYRQSETGLRWDRFGQSLILKVQRLDGNTWNDVWLAYRNGYQYSEVWVNADSGWHLSQMGETNRQFRFNRRGTYRILIGLGNETGGKDLYIKNYRYYGGYGYYETVWNQNYHLWNEATGEGIFYIRVE